MNIGFDLWNNYQNWIGQVVEVLNLQANCHVHIAAVMVGMEASREQIRGNWSIEARLQGCWRL